MSTDEPKPQDSQAGDENGEDRVLPRKNPPDYVMFGSGTEMSALADAMHKKGKNVVVVGDPMPSTPDVSVPLLDILLIGEAAKLEQLADALRSKGKAVLVIELIHTELAVALAAIHAARQAIFVFWANTSPNDNLVVDELNNAEKSGKIVHCSLAPTASFETVWRACGGG